MPTSEPRIPGACQAWPSDPRPPGRGSADGTRGSARRRAHGARRSGSCRARPRGPAPQIDPEARPGEARVTDGAGEAIPESRPAELSPGGSPGQARVEPEGARAPRRRRVARSARGPAAGRREPPGARPLVQDRLAEGRRHRAPCRTAPRDPRRRPSPRRCRRRPRRQATGCGANGSQSPSCPGRRLAGSRPPGRRDDESARRTGARADGTDVHALAGRQAMEARAQPERPRDALDEESVQGAPRHPRQKLPEHDEPDVAVDAPGSPRRASGATARALATTSARAAARTPAGSRARGASASPRRTGANSGSERRQARAMGQEVRQRRPRRGRPPTPGSELPPPASRGRRAPSRQSVRNTAVVATILVREARSKTVPGVASPAAPSKTRRPRGARRPPRTGKTPVATPSSRSAWRRAAPVTRRASASGRGSPRGRTRPADPAGRRTRDPG